jgi:hypothetical protein
VVIGVICDGCGKSPHSEVGAKIGAKLIADAIRDTYFGTFPETMMEVIRQAVIAKLNVICEVIGKTWSDGRFSRSATIRDYLLFTAVGFIINPQSTVVFLKGDGIIAVNGTIRRFDSGERNEPNYLAYGMTETDKPLEIRSWQYDTSDVQSVMVASDGAGYIMDRAEQKMVNSEETVGGLDQFLGDVYFQNQDQIRRRLYKIGNRSKRMPTRISDDCTIVVARREQQ